VEFKALSEKDKAKWDKLAAADKERYLAEMETYSPPYGF
jgi:ketosteroid isomerase-like protein